MGHKDAQSRGEKLCLLVRLARTHGPQRRAIERREGSSTARSPMHNGERVATVWGWETMRCLSIAQRSMVIAGRQIPRWPRAAAPRMIPKNASMVWNFNLSREVGRGTGRLGQSSTQLSAALQPGLTKECAESRVVLMAQRYQ